MIKKGNHELRINHQYINFPVKNDAIMRKVRFWVGNQVARFFEIEWAEGEPDFWVFTDVAEFKGKRLVIEIDEAEKKHPLDGDTSSTGDSENLLVFIHSDTIEGEENLYREKYRPQFHFTSRRGWINDPNGLVYYQGTYHLFYQHNPYGRKWGNMHWGHASSKNLVHWHEDSDVFYPDEMGTMFSGCAFVDWDNITGLKTGLNDPLICFYTAAGEYVEPKVPFTQCMAYSLDRGLTWQKYEDNPILPQIASSTRDPNVSWHSDSRQWIMALYIGYIKERAEDRHHFALFASPDLKKWDRLQDLYFPGSGECPEFFPIPLDGDPLNIKWVFWTADGYYLIGSFDGSRFMPETPLVKSTYSAMGEIRGGYAAQTWRDIPVEDGRRIQIAWLAGDILAMPFNQQMTFPVELTLKTTDDGPRLHSWPVREIEELFQERQTLENVEISDDPTILSADEHELLDIQTTIDVGDADAIDLNFRGIPLIYNVSEQEISCLERSAPLKAKAGKIDLRVLLDRASIEIYAADGLVYLPIKFIFADHNTTCFMRSRGGKSLANTITITKLHPSWE